MPETPLAKVISDWFYTKLVHVDKDDWEGRKNIVFANALGVENIKGDIFHFPEGIADYSFDLPPKKWTL